MTRIRTERLNLEPAKPLRAKRGSLIIIAGTQEMNKCKRGGTRTNADGADGRVVVEGEAWRVKRGAWSVKRGARRVKRGAGSVERGGTERVQGSGFRARERQQRIQHPTFNTQHSTSKCEVSGGDQGVGS